MKNNITKGVFTGLVESLDKKSSFHTFIDIDELLLIEFDKYGIVKTKGSDIVANHQNSEIKYLVNEKLVKAKQEYSRIIRGNEFRKIVDKLVTLETEMIQARCFLKMDIKLGIAKRVLKTGEKVEYIIARTPFYRPGYVRSEVTVYMGGTDELGDDLEKLKNDSKFMSNAYEELRDVMKKEMGL